MDIRRVVLIGLAALTAAPGVALAQRPYVQLGGGFGLGAWTENVPDRSLFAVGAFAAGLQRGTLALRLDARILDTDDEPLLAVGVAGGVISRGPNWPHVYLLGAAGYGLFLEEGDPASHVGAVVGLVAGRRPGVAVELRYDYLLSQFTYQSRSRHLVSAVVALRLGALAP